MLNAIKKIWKDPVWSKIISVGIIGLISILYYALVSGTGFEQTIKDSLNIKVNIGYIILAVIIIIILSIVSLIVFKKYFFYNEEHKELDRTLFLRIKNELLPANGSISFIRTNNFAGFAFRNENIYPLYQFSSNFDDPNFEFIDKKLNKQLEKFKISINNFNSLISLNTWPVDNSGGDFNTVPPEWEIEQPERFRRIVNKIHNSKNEVCKLYDELIKLGRKKIGV